MKRKKNAGTTRAIKIPAPTPRAIKIPAPTPTVPTQEIISETDEERTARCDRANKAIREVLQNENCTLRVPYLDISSGRVVPQIQVFALQPK